MKRRNFQQYYLELLISLLRITIRRFDPESLFLTCTNECIITTKEAIKIETDSKRLLYEEAQKEPKLNKLKRAQLTLSPKFELRLKTRHKVSPINPNQKSLVNALRANL